jgi:uncharacterized protein
MQLTEPAPLWPDAPRHAWQYDFPSYRFIPGLNPHPTARTDGHSYGKKEEKPAYLSSDQWRDNGLYLFGIDLYHQSFFWEAHEAWEAIWHLTQKQDPEGQYLQGLIQNSASQLKLHIGNFDGARHLSQESVRRLSTVLDAGACDQAGCYMGLELRAFIDTMKFHYGPLWEGHRSVFQPSPLIKLAP